jgi:hypothetical protein
MKDMFGTEEDGPSDDDEIADDDWTLAAVVDAAGSNALRIPSSC